jgi:hypothetical protein
MEVRAKVTGRGLKARGVTHLIEVGSKSNWSAIPGSARKRTSLACISFLSAR